MNRNRILPRDQVVAELALGLDELEAMQPLRLAAVDLEGGLQTAIQHNLECDDSELAVGIRGLADRLHTTAHESTIGPIAPKGWTFHIPGVTVIYHFGVTERGVHFMNPQSLSTRKSLWQMRFGYW
jgi:hypothetical protein